MATRPAVEAVASVATAAIRGVSYSPRRRRMNASMARPPSSGSMGSRANSASCAPVQWVIHRASIHQACGLLSHDAEIGSGRPAPIQSPVTMPSAIPMAAKATAETAVPTAAERSAASQPGAGSIPCKLPRGHNTTSAAEPPEARTTRARVDSRSNTKRNSAPTAMPTVLAPCTDDSSAGPYEPRRTTISA